MCVVGTRIIIVILLWLGYCASNKTFSKFSDQTETVVIAHSDALFAIEEPRSFYQVSVKPKKSSFSLKEKKVLLTLLSARVDEAPDGALEVYVSLKPIDRSKFVSERRDFVNVIDLYTIEGTTKKNVVLDLTTTLSKLLKEGHTLPTLYLTVLFRGNKLSNGEESKKAGKVSFEGFRFEIVR